MVEAQEGPYESTLPTAERRPGTVDTPDVPETCHTARDIEVRSYQEGRGTFHEVRCRLCGRDAEHHEGLPRESGERG